MTLDRDLVEKAKGTGARLAEAERQAQLARAEYHTVVRRLHLAGGSLREIAEALGLSHQRVQQIVAERGGTWWSRVWRSRAVKRDTVCTFCGRPPSEVSKLIAGPNVYICDGCVGGAEAMLAGRSRGRTALALSNGACSFCGKRAGAARRVVAAAEAGACDACLALCREILEDRRS